MKQFFEGAPANGEMLQHLDRCLTCRSCETTCPSGVSYSHLLEIGREAIEQEYQRPWVQRLQRWVVLRFILSGWLFRGAIRLGQLVSAFLPARLQGSVPVRQVAVPYSRGRHARKVLMLAGCVQETLTPNTNVYASSLLDQLGVEVIEIPSRFCCGSAAAHTSAAELGRHQAKQLIDAFWPHVEAGAEAIVVTATGCGVSIRDYGRMLAGDTDYARKAAKISELHRDLIEIIDQEQDQMPATPILPEETTARRVAVHTPCTLQHGLKMVGRIERILTRCGYQICRVEEAHLCCGSAGTYSMLQPDLSARLRHNKLNALKVAQPDVIATANVGCQMHLGADRTVPVVHWIELLHAAMP